MIETPNSYEEMTSIFGDIRPYIFEDGTLDYSWENTVLLICYLPFPMKLAWNEKVVVTKFRCHHLLSDTFRMVFSKILVEGLQDKCEYFGGCYNFRCKRGSKKISTHAWGIAIDLNPMSNQFGTKGNMDERIIEIFESFGFVWGGRFKVSDPMHFQFVKNY